MDIRDHDERIDLNGIPGAALPANLLGHLWRFDVAKSFSAAGAGDIVTLEFSGTEDVPCDVALFLVDTELEKLIDLQREHSYEYFLGKRAVVTDDADARFILLAGSPDYIDANREYLPTLPSRTCLHQNYPNPFNPSTLVRYDIAEPGLIDLRIFDVHGALVAVLYAGHREAGRYEAGWNGEDQRGEPVSSGMYYCRLVTPSKSESRKMLLLK